MQPLKSLASVANELGDETSLRDKYSLNASRMIEDLVALLRRATAVN
jgi:hypothetical protein